MALCINPSCPHPNHPDNGTHTRCQACQAELILRGRYRVMRLITDTSGFGKVYEVFERDQPKILKVLKPVYNIHPKAVQLFEQEAIVLGHLDHLGVPRIDPDGYFQVSPVEGGPSLHCIVMEKIDGPNLSEWMRQQGNYPIGEAQALQWLQQLTDVLHLIHQQHFFHRDIKPENIMLRSSGQLVLVDFGAVREMSHTYFEQLDSTGGITRISSAGYTPPEQERGQAVLQSDFYSLGCTFIYLLTGKRPLDGDIYHHLTNELQWRPFAPHISTAFADFIDQLIAERVVDRPAHTLDILATLGQLQERDRQNQKIGKGSIANNLSQSNAASMTPNRPVIEGETATLPPEEMGLDGNATSIPEHTQHQLSTTAPSSLHPPLAKRPGPVALPSASTTDATNIPPAETLMQSTTTIQAVPSGLRQKLQWVAVGILVVGSIIGGVLGGRSLLWSQLQSRLPALEVQRQSDTSPPLSFSLVTTLDGHTGTVNALALSLDQRLLVSGSDDKTVWVWDLVTGDRRQLVGHGDRVQAVAISPNSQIVASGGGDPVIKLWNPITGEAIADLEGHTSSINDLTITANGQILVSASADHTIKLWDLVSRTEITTLTGHTSYVNAISISPDGTLLASGAADRTVKLWDLVTREEIATLEEHKSFINAIAFSLNGAYLISAGADKKVKIWDRTTYKLVETLEHHTSFVNELGLTLDGQFLVSTSADQSIAVWDLNTLDYRASIPWRNTLVNAVVVRATGSTWQVIAGGQGSASIQIWNYDSEENPTSDRP